MFALKIYIVNNHITSVIFVCQVASSVVQEYFYDSFAQILNVFNFTWYIYLLYVNRQKYFLTI